MASSRLRHGWRLPAVGMLALALGAGALAGSAPSSAEDTPDPAASSAPAGDGAPATGPAVPVTPAVPSRPAGSDAISGESGGGMLPGQRPDAETPEQATSDAAPALNPGFVDEYSVLWKKVQRDQHRVQVLSSDMKAARNVLDDSWDDQVTAMRQRGRADATLAVASGEFTLAIRDLYISGSTDVDMVMNVLGSKPDELLRNLDSLLFLRSATGNEGLDLQAAQQWSTIVDSANAAVEIRAEADARHAASVAADLARAKRTLKRDNDLLQHLISIAAPQTVVGKDGCPKAVLDGTVPPEVNVRQLCKHAVRNAVTPQAAIAVKWALLRLGAPYACEGIGRLDPWRYDCSSYVSRAYAEGAGLGTAGEGWAPSTRNMVPWDGVPLDPHYAPIPAGKLRPGDLVLYDTCPAGETCPYRHVVMYLGPQEKGGVPMMAHTNGCGLVAHVEPFWGTDLPNYLGSRRVMALPGERLTVNLPAAHRPGRPGHR